MKKDNDKWYKAVWLPFAAGTYIIICIFDFMVMPVYVAAHNSRIEARVFEELNGKDVATFATAVAQTAQATRQWNPLTLMGAGMFHLAFGALLTGGAVTRGLARRSEVEGYYKYGAAGYDQNSDEGEEYSGGRYGSSDRYGGNRPYKPNTPGTYNGNRNQREGSDGPSPKTDRLEDGIK